MRTSTGFESESPAPNKEKTKKVAGDPMYETEYGARFSAASEASKKFNSIEAAGCRMPGSYKLT